MQKYHFFYNKATLIFTNELEKKDSTSASVECFDYAREGDLLYPMDLFLHQQRSLIVRMKPDLENKLLWEFLSYFRVEKAAGGIVENEKGEYLCIQRFGFRDLPKGHVEAGETFEQTALREVEEETGVGNLTIVRPLRQTYHIFVHADEFVLKQTQWFAMKTSFNGVLKAQTEEQITDACWLSPDKMQSLYPQFYPSLRLLLSQESYVKGMEEF